VTVKKNDFAGELIVLNAVHDSTEAVVLVSYIWLLFDCAIIFYPYMSMD